MEKLRQQSSLLLLSTGRDSLTTSSSILSMLVGMIWLASSTIMSSMKQWQQLGVLSREHLISVCIFSDVMSNSPGSNLVSCPASFSVKEKSLAVYLVKCLFNFYSVNQRILVLQSDCRSWIMSSLSRKDSSNLLFKLLHE